MNLIFAITVLVMRHVALHSCRTLDEHSDQAPRRVHARSPHEEHVPDVPPPHSQRSSEAKHDPSAKQEHEHLVKIILPHDDERGRERRLFKTNTKRLIELLPLRQKGKGKTVAYILASDGDKRAFRGLINEQLNVDDKESSHSYEDVSDDSEENKESLDSVKATVKEGSHENHDTTLSNENTVNVVHTILRESNSREETSADSNSEDARHDDGKESRENSHGLDINDASNDRSEPQDSHPHHAQAERSREDSVGGGYLDEIVITEIDHKDYSEEHSNSHTIQLQENDDGHIPDDDESKNYSKREPVESQDESDKSEGDLDVEWDITQENNSPIKKHSTHVTIETLDLHTSESTSKEEGSSIEYTNEGVNIENGGDKNSKEITETKINDLIKLPGSHETHEEKCKYECERDSRREESPRGKRPRHSRPHNTYSLSFLFNR